MLFHWRGCSPDSSVVEQNEVGGGARLFLLVTRRLHEKHWFVNFALKQGKTCCYLKLRIVSKKNRRSVGKGVILR